jgi:predicted MPP superfamily phosphohydrolase
MERVMVLKKKRNIILLAICITVLLILAIWTIWGNSALEMNTYTILSNRLPEAFDGYRIAHISDLHNAEMGNKNENLILMLKEAQPDIIAITGDIIDSRNTNIEIALQFTEEAIKIAPCYYVTGNHEARIFEYDELKKGLTELGVVVLEDEYLEIKQFGETITLLGVNDPNFQIDYLFGDSASVMRNKLQELTDEKDTYTVLLSHRPELFDVYTENKVDLVLSGHAHGGQFRFPFVGGLVAPNQGLFPKYDAGLYTDENTSMIVSRGIGNSILPFRFNNRPEVILIELKTAL